MNRNSPGFIHLLLHYHFSGEPPETMGMTKEWTDQMLLDGLIERRVDDLSFTTTIRGQGYVEMLCKTPYPVQKWIDPRFHEEKLFDDH